MADDPPKPGSDIATLAPARERTHPGVAAAILLVTMAIGGAFIGFYKSNESAEQALKAETAAKLARDDAEAAAARENATQELLATAKGENSKLAEQLAATQLALA